MDHVVECVAGAGDERPSLGLRAFDDGTGEHPDLEAGLDTPTEFERHGDRTQEPTDGHEDALRRAVNGRC
ncbi:hypothetical protein [Amycolatopsis sp. NPDC051102]|uniref:hypothetical protein n=1 Tax=Amycolatopsis sp. NPDC051102 TaxID=3155163 RepID=UPI0034424106